MGPDTSHLICIWHDIAFADLPHKALKCPCSAHDGSAEGSHPTVSLQNKIRKANHRLHLTSFQAHGCPFVVLSLGAMFDVCTCASTIRSQRPNAR